MRFETDAKTNRVYLRRLFPLITTRRLLIFSSVGSILLEQSGTLNFSSSPLPTLVAHFCSPLLVTKKGLLSLAKTDIVFLLGSSSWCSLPSPFIKCFSKKVFNFRTKRRKKPASLEKKSKIAWRQRRTDKKNSLVRRWSRRQHSSATSSPGGRRWTCPTRPPTATTTTWWSITHVRVSPALQSGSKARTPQKSNASISIFWDQLFLVRIESKFVE